MTKPIHPDDPILGPVRGSADVAINAIRRSVWPRSVEFSEACQAAQEYVKEVFRLAPLVGIDPAVVVAQGALETGNWTSEHWIDRRNPAGIGVLGDPGGPVDDLGYAWKDGTDAARGQIVHLAAYTLIPIDRWSDVWRVLTPYKSLDPRLYAFEMAGWSGTVVTIRDLTGKWATDPLYAEKTAKRGNELFGFKGTTDDQLA